jgi:hypothetical protein
MAYTAPNTFTTGTAINGPLLRDNFIELRQYLDGGIAVADVASTSVKTTDIVRGEYVNVVPDHQFTTGDILTQFQEIDEYSRSYSTSHYKQYDLFADIFSIIPNTGKRIVLESNAAVIYTVSIAGVGEENYQLTRQKRASKVYVRLTTGDLIRPTDDISTTVGYVFTEDSVNTDVDNSGNTVGGDSGFISRRWYVNRCRFDLPKGTYNISLVTDPECDKLRFSARNANVEIFYR